MRDRAIKLCRSRYGGCRLTAFGEQRSVSRGKLDNDRIVVVRLHRQSEEAGKMGPVHKNDRVAYTGTAYDKSITQIHRLRQVESLYRRGAPKLRCFLMPECYGQLSVTTLGGQ